MIPLARVTPSDTEDKLSYQKDVAACHACDRDFFVQILGRGSCREGKSALAVAALRTCCISALFTHPHFDFLPFRPFHHFFHLSSSSSCVRTLIHTSLDYLTGISMPSFMRATSPPHRLSKMTAPGRSIPSARSRRRPRPSRDLSTALQRHSHRLPGCRTSMLFIITGVESRLRLWQRP